MTVDVLSSIKGAQPSETVNKLFDVIKLSDLPLPASASILYLAGHDRIAFMKGVKP